MTKILGLTGGIATGKSTVSKIFAKHDIPIVDGDIIAREIVEPGKPALAALVQAFGEGILQTDGSLDRKRLGNIVFHDDQKRQLMNQTLNQYLRQAINQAIANQVAQQVPLVVVDLPLMYEGHYDRYMDEVMVVYVPEAVQQERLQVRDQLSREEAAKRINSQMPIEEKKARADWVIDNQGTREETKFQVENWLKTKTAVEPS